MKQFLVLLAVLPLMLVIMVEFSLNSLIDVKVDAINDIVYTCKEQARQDGTFSNVAPYLIKTISDVTHIKESDIYLTYSGITTGEKIYRIDSMSDASEESFIHYRVEVPIVEMKTLGLILKSNKRNYIYVIDSYTASERLQSEDQ